MYVLELSQKSNDDDSFEHWVIEVHKLREHLEVRFKVAITDAALRDAIGVMNRERALRRLLAELMVRENPPLNGCELLGFKSLISGMEEDQREYEKAILALGALPAAESSRAPVRVLVTGVPIVHGAERVLELIEKCGAVVVCMENCTGLKPILEDVDLSEPDPIRAIARKYYHLPCSVMTSNRDRLDTLRALVAQYRPQCVIELIWQACLTYDVESFKIRQLVEEELSLPYLKITTDYSPSDSARITARVEAMIEIVRGKC